MLSTLRNWRTPVLAFVITLGLAETALWLIARQTQERQLVALQTRAVDLRTLLLTELNTSLYLANGVEAFIKANQGAVAPAVLDP